MVKRKSFILSLCVVLMIFITTTITFSLSNPNIEITYGNETYESNEAFKMQWYSNDDEIKFTVNLSKQYESYVGNGGTLSSEEVPFKVKAKYNANKKEKEFKDDLISIKELENALYEVTIKNQLVENVDIYIDVIMESSNIWAAEKFTKSFNIKVDKTAPIINIIDFPEDNAVVISNKLNLSFKVTEDNLNKDHITIVAKKNGETVNIDWKLEQKGNVLTYIADSLESGVNEFEISAEDMAGNKAVIIKNDSEIGECFKSIFQFQRSGKLDFFDVPAEGIFKEEVLFKGYIYFIRDIDIYYSVNDGIKEKIDTKYDVITKRVSFEKKFNEDGKYKVWAEWKQNDNAEKVIYDIGTYIVDKNAPIITINNVAEGNNEPLENKRYEETVKVSISVEDDNLVYDRDGKLNEEKNKIIISYADGTEEIKTFHNTTTVLDTIEEAICDISVESTDAAGNSSKEKRSIIVDSRAPEIKVNFEEVNQFNHYNKEVKFTASITDATLSFDDANAYNELELVKLNSNGDETVAKVIDLKNGYADEDINISSWSIADVSERKGTITAKISGTINKEFDGNFILRVRSKDSCNHESSLEKAFTIDNKAPVVTYNGKDKLLNKYKTAKDIDILIEEENLYSAEIICKISNENKDSEVVYESKVDLNSQEINNKTIIKKLKLDEDGHYELTVKAKDKAGNEYSKVQEFVIDSGKPKITVDGVDVTKNEIVNSYKESKEITVTVRDLTLDKNNTTLVLKRNGEEVTKVVGDKWGRGLYKVSNNITINIEDEGLYTLEVTAKDRVNEEASYVTTTFEIDGTKPVVNIDGVIDNEVITLQNLVDKLKISVEEKNYFHEEYSPEFKITKNNKDVLYLEYKKEEIINISEKEIKRVFAEDGHYKIEVTAEDKAGNKADKNKLILEFVVDNEPPEILFSGIDDNSKNGFNDNRNLSITVNEANYSTNNVVITAEKDDKDYYVGEFISNNISSIFTKEFKEDGYYEIKVEAIDGAGNRTEKNISFLIDISGPGLIINGFENGIYNEESAFTHYNTTRNVEVKLTDKNFKLDENGDFVKPTFEIYDHSKGTNVTDAIVGDNSWNISDEEMILKFDITAVSEDGKYEIKFNYTDECGNRSDYENLYVVIDGVNPEISLSGIEDKSFNNISKSLMIKVLERNFESNTVIINGTKDGEAFDIGSFTSTLEESKLTYNFTEEGLYTFEVLSKDFAGNEAITKNISFTIDKTNPEINIAGVIDGESYNVSKAVDISILDRNHNLNKVTVTKDGLEMNIGSFSLSEDMALLSYNFSEEGDYVITVNSTDKAENSSSKSVKFTIDKTSPVITPMISGKDTVIKDGAYINEVFTPYFKLDESEDTITSVIRFDFIALSIA